MTPPGFRALVMVPGKMEAWEGLSFNAFHQRKLFSKLWVVAHGWVMKSVQWVETSISFLMDWDRAVNIRVHSRL